MGHEERINDKICQGDLSENHIRGPRRVQEIFLLDDVADAKAIIDGHYRSLNGRRA